MSKDRYRDGGERRHPHRRGSSSEPKTTGKASILVRTEETMKTKKVRPDFTRAETYMQEQAPARADRSRIDADMERENEMYTALLRVQRRRALIIAGVLLVAGLSLILLSDIYGSVVDSIAGVAATFAIIATIHVVRPGPLLRFALVVIALTCLAVTFATILNLHLHGIN